MKRKFICILSALLLPLAASLFVVSCDVEYTTWIDGEKVTFDEPQISFLHRSEFLSCCDKWDEPENYSFKYEIRHGSAGPTTIAAVTVKNGNASVTYSRNEFQGERCDSLSALLRFFENYYQARCTTGNDGKAWFYSVVYNSEITDSFGYLTKTPYKLSETVLDMENSSSGSGYGDLVIYISDLSFN